MIGETVIAEDREDVSFIWFNEYDEESQLNDIDLKVFVQEERSLSEVSGRTYPERIFFTRNKADVRRKRPGIFTGI